MTAFHCTDVSMDLSIFLNFWNFPELCLLQCFFFFLLGNTPTFYILRFYKCFLNLLIFSPVFNHCLFAWVSGRLPFYSVTLLNFQFLMFLFPTTFFLSLNDPLIYLLLLWWNIYSYEVIKIIFLKTFFPPP